MKIKKMRERPTRVLVCILGVNKNNQQNGPKGLAVIDDGDHVLDVALWKLTIFQVLLLVSNGLVPVPEMHSKTGRAASEDRILQEMCKKWEFCFLLRYEL